MKWNKEKDKIKMKKNEWYWKNEIWINWKYIIEKWKW